MNLHRLLKEREAIGQPLRVGLIGAGKFGSMFLSQVRHAPGMRVTAIADLNPQGARDALRRVGWSDSAIAALRLFDEAARMIGEPDIDIVIDATGSATAGIAHVLACCEHGKHIIMVNVEADALAGPLLARRAQEAGIVYSLAYGDQPALICEMVDWARTCGLEVIAAGKGTKYLPAFHASTPETVWQYYGMSAAEAAAGGLNAKMFNSFLDGTKSAIEMCAVSNATGLIAPEGLGFPPCGVDQLPSVLAPLADGGVLHHRGQVEVISSMNRDGSPVARDLRWGVFVVFAGGSDYVERCFREYGLVTDVSGQYSALYKPFHLIGLELGISVASIGLRGEATGAAIGFNADVAATAKRDLAKGELLDGEGGYTVYGRLLPATDSLRIGALPLGLAHGMRLAQPVAAGQMLSWVDVEIDESQAAMAFRRELERVFSTAPADSGEPSVRE